jgi:5-methylcytosine-specific restriction endonuclease McrA
MRIHDTKFDCGKKPQRRKEKNDKDRFRSTAAWQRKTVEIKNRDSYLCQVCIRKLYDTYRQYTYDGLEVHHVIPLQEDFDRRLDNESLITLCERHHEMAERGEIPRGELLNIVQEQENIPPPSRSGKTKVDLDLRNWDSRRNHSEYPAEIQLAS